MAIAAPVLAICGCAVWSAFEAAVENVKFARSTEQVLSIIAVAQDDASKDPSFDQARHEDIIDDLERRGQLLGTPKNPWGGGIRASVAAPATMRLETDLPSYVCGRLAVYLSKNAGDLKLQKMGAAYTDHTPTAFFDAAVNSDANEIPGANEACGTAPHTTLALTIRLR
jgi:hypothetical protein